MSNLFKNGRKGYSTGDTKSTKSCNKSIKKAKTICQVEISFTHTNYQIIRDDFLKSLH